MFLPECHDNTWHWIVWTRRPGYGSRCETRAGGNAFVEFSRRYEGVNDDTMTGEQPPRDWDWTDSRQGSTAHRSRSRLGLGLFVLLIVAGSVWFQFVRGGFPREIGLLVPLLGAVMGSALLGEHVTPRCRSTTYRGLCLPAIELLATYSLFGVLTVAVTYGLVATGAVSGLLLFCGFAAFILTL